MVGPQRGLVVLLQTATTADGYNPNAIARQDPTGTASRRAAGSACRAFVLGAAWDECKGARRAATRSARAGLSATLHQLNQPARIEDERIDHGVDCNVRGIDYR